MKAKIKKKCVGENKIEKGGMKALTKKHTIGKKICFL